MHLMQGHSPPDQLNQRVLFVDESCNIHAQMTLSADNRIKVAYSGLRQDHVCYLGSLWAVCGIVYVNINVKKQNFDINILISILLAFASLLSRPVKHE